MSRKLILLFSLLFMVGMVQLYEDYRCRCVCPATVYIANNTERSLKTLYIAYVPSKRCNCHGVVLPKVSDELKLNAGILCPRCKCKYETRNTTVIMFVVLLVLWAISLLVGHYLFIILMELLINGKLIYEGIRPTPDETEDLLHEGEELEEF